MIVCMDANYFAELIEQNASTLRDADNNEIPDCRERTLQFLRDNKATILIPCVVLGEVMMISSVSNEDLLKYLHENVSILVAPYDSRAAAKHAEVEEPYLRAKNKWADRDKDEKVAARIKADRQMLATAAAHGADCIFTSDKGVRKDAHRYGIKTMCASQVALHDQHEMEFKTEESEAAE